MAVKSKTPSRTPRQSVTAKANSGVTLKPPLTLDEHLERIEAMGKSIDEYVKFMLQAAGKPGTSAESTDRAVRAFYQQLLIVERQLGKIHDELRLE